MIRFLKLRLLRSLAIAILLVGGGNVLAVAQRVGSPTVQQARSNYETAGDVYASVKRLAERGSASQSELRQARLQRKLAAIELSDLRDPRRRGYNRLVRATAIYRYHDQEYDIAKRLHQKGATSDVAYRRAESARKVAKLNLQALRSPTEVKRQLKQIEAAGARLSLVQKEHAIAQRLLKSGSLSQSGFDRVTRRLSKAKEAHAASKRNLSVRVVQVRT